MGDEDQLSYEEDDLDALDDFDEDVSLDESDDDPLESKERVDAKAQARINARHAIERRNELKALKSELDEWDDIDEDDL